MCPDCTGKGKIALFTSVEPCKSCNGTGHIAVGQHHVLPEQTEASQATQSARYVQMVGRAERSNSRPIIWRGPTEREFYRQHFGCE